MSPLDNPVTLSEIRLGKRSHSMIYCLFYAIKQICLGNSLVAYSELGRSAWLMKRICMED